MGQGNLLTWIEAFGINVCQQSAEFQELGSWSLSFYDGNTPLYTNPFSVSHNSNGLLGITSPTFNQLVDLDDQSQNYTATPPVAFQAGTSTGNIMSWSGTLNYETSGGYGITLGVLPSFASVNNETQYQTYQSVGGQVQTEASVTASDSSSVNDCVTFYIEGPAGGVPDANITSQLVSSAQSYPSSAYYPNTYYPQDGTATPDLMAQVAMAESSYRQFTSHQDQPPNADLWNLDATYGVVAKWPDESPTVNPGAYIGLMQVMTDADQSSDPNAWNWLQNAADGVGLFSGTPPAEYNDKSKMQHAIDYMNEAIQEYVPGPPPNFQLPPLSGHQLENQALVLYGPGAADPTQEFCIPACSSGVWQYDSATNNYLCVGGTWSWSENSQGSPAVNYVDRVRQESVASCR